MEGKILVCGGTGFIGQSLVESLEERKVRLLVHNRFPAELGSLGDRLEFTYGDLLRRASLDEALTGVSFVVNLVGAYSGDLYNLNICSSYNLLEACRGRDVQRILFISSEAVYGECCEKPALEADLPKPSTEYALTKYLAECLYKLYAEAYSLPASVLRLANVYGPGRRAGVVFDFLSPFLQEQPIVINDDGQQRRDFVYVSDAIQGIKNALDYKSPQKFEIFNISGSKLISLLELASLIERVAKRKAQIKFAKYDASDMRCLWSSHEKAKALLGYKPKIELAQGLEMVLEHTQRTDRKREK